MCTMSIVPALRGRLEHIVRDPASIQPMRYITYVGIGKPSPYLVKTGKTDPLISFLSECCKEQPESSAALRRIFYDHHLCMPSAIEVLCALRPVTAFCRPPGLGATMVAHRPFRLPVHTQTESFLLLRMHTAYVHSSPKYCLLYRVKYTRQHRISQAYPVEYTGMPHGFQVLRNAFFLRILRDMHKEARGISPGFGSLFPSAVVDIWGKKQQLIYPLIEICFDMGSLSAGLLSF